jgi:hypothetical protein
VRFNTNLINSLVSRFWLDETFKKYSYLKLQVQMIW